MGTGRESWRESRSTRQFAGSGAALRGSSQLERRGGMGGGEGGREGGREREAERPASPGGARSPTTRPMRRTNEQIPLISRPNHPSMIRSAGPQTGRGWPANAGTMHRSSTPPSPATVPRRRQACIPWSRPGSRWIESPGAPAPPARSPPAPAGTNSLVECVHPSGSLCLGFGSV